MTTVGFNSIYKQKFLVQQDIVSRETRHTLVKIGTAVACFAAGHETIYKTDLGIMDVHFRKRFCSVVGDKYTLHTVHKGPRLLGKFKARNYGSIELQKTVYAATPSHGGGSFERKNIGN